MCIYIKIPDISAISSKTEEIKPDYICMALTIQTDAVFLWKHDAFLDLSCAYLRTPLDAHLQDELLRGIFDVHKQV